MGRCYKEPKPVGDSTGCPAKKRRYLSNHKVSENYLEAARTRRVLMLMIIDHVISMNDHARLKTALGVNIQVFAMITKAFEDYIECLRNGDQTIQSNEHVMQSFEQFRKIIYTESWAPKNGLSPVNALVLLFLFYTGAFVKKHHAQEHGWDDAGVLRDATAHLLRQSLKKYHPIKVRKLNIILISVIFLKKICCSFSLRIAENYGYQ